MNTSLNNIRNYINFINNNDVVTIRDVTKKVQLVLTSRTLL